MMKFEVVTTLLETIKPSSPTPSHLRSFKLCVLDQLAPALYTPLWLFYPSNHNHDDPLSFKMATLKDALSKTLTRFYPLAGRILDSISIHCNDEGAIFMQAKVLGCDMHGFIEESSNSKFELLNKLLPCQVRLTCSMEKAPQVLIKVNVFACGGIAIGMCLLHTLVDGTTFGDFIKTWADIARSSTTTITGQDENHNNKRSSTVVGTASLLFPPNESLSLGDLGSVSCEEKKDSVIKRFVFDANAISFLKSKAKSENVPNPTRVEVVSALLWKCVARISGFSASKRQPSVLVNCVNLRTRLDPPLPENSLGNIFWLAIAKDNGSDQNIMDLAYYVDLLRKPVKEIDSNYIRNMQGGEEGSMKIRKFYEDAHELFSKSGLPLEVSSLSRMGFYEADFGWGEPSWVATAPQVNNEILLMGTKSGDGIEAFVMLDERRMTILQRDLEMQASTSD